MNKDRDIEQGVGLTLQRLRSERGLTLSELATRSGVSTGMISRIEHGNVSPSLATLQALADALKVPLMALFARADTATDVHHARAGDGLQAKRITQGHSHNYLLLGKHSAPQGIFQSARICISKTEAENLPSYQHEGYVFIYLIEGQATYRCGSDEFEMSAGDTLSFDAKLPHGFHEILSDKIEFITVSNRQH